jgi:hypothetical protein
MNYLLMLLVLMHKQLDIICIRNSMKDDEVVLFLYKITVVFLLNSQLQNLFIN